MCSIDAMAYLYNALPGEDNIGENFRNWVIDWIVPLNCDCRPDVLYALRCGLVHTYGYARAMERCGVVSFLYTHNHPERHWTQPNENVFVLNLDSHVAEVTIGAYDFFDKLREICESSSERVRLIVERIQQLIYLQSHIMIQLNSNGQTQILTKIEIPDVYSEMDMALSSLDLQEQPRVEAIREAIREIY